jgi:hypothetical protein
MADETARETETRNMIAAVFRKREENGGRHLHHFACIHNLPPEEQVAVRGRTVEWWTKVIGPLPEQITPDDWETDPPDWERHR